MPALVLIKIRLHECSIFIQPRGWIKVSELVKKAPIELLLAVNSEVVGLAPGPNPTPRFENKNILLYLLSKTL
jgi:hypothetical protein